jgi:hypothetical protein
MSTTHPNNPGSSRWATGGGHWQLLILAVVLVGAGLVVVGLGVSGKFLPHDERFLGMTAEELCAVHGCRIVHFMVHDRVSFGGAVTAVGLLYLWLALSPLRQGQVWAWWALLLSGVVGFASFFAYLGYGYLDSWHGLATLGLAPCYLVGLACSAGPRTDGAGVRCLLRPGVAWPWSSAAGAGRGCLLLTAAGLVLGGLTILLVGMTCVFVPQDLAYLGLSVEELRALNPRLMPLIAHDRAGFGGAVCCCGVALFFCVWCGRPAPGLWCVLALVGVVGFGTAIGIHPAVGYNDAVHLAPGVLGALTYLAGAVLTYRPMVRGSRSPFPVPVAPDCPSRI